MIRGILFSFILLATTNVFGQDMFKALMREHNMYRYGIGAQVFDPTGINFQLFRGFFCSNNSSYATYGVWELGIGAENILGITNEKSYGAGTWKPGGLRVDFNYLYPIYTLESAMVVQTYLGAGLQTGSRKYEVSGVMESNFATGGNVIFRTELVTNGIDMGRSVWFLSVYADFKFHFDFSEDFNYLTPALGLRMRKGR